MKGLLLIFQLVGLVLSRTTSRIEDIPPDQDSQEAEVTDGGEDEVDMPPPDGSGGLTSEELKIVSLLERIQEKYPKLPEEDRYEFLAKLSSYRDRFAATIAKVERQSQDFGLNLPLLKWALDLSPYEDEWVVEEGEMPRAPLDPFPATPGVVENAPLYDMVVKGKLQTTSQNPLSPEDDQEMEMSRMIDDSLEHEMVDSLEDDIDLPALKKMGIDSATLSQMTKMKPLQLNRLVKKLLMSNVLKSLLATPPATSTPAPSWYNPYSQQHQYQSYYGSQYSPAHYYQQGYSPMQLSRSSSVPLMQDLPDSKSFKAASGDSPVADPDLDIDLDLDFLRKLDNVKPGTRLDREMQQAARLLGDTLDSIPFEDFHSVDLQLNLPYPRHYHGKRKRSSEEGKRKRRHAGGYGRGRWSAYGGGRPYGPYGRGYGGIDGIELLALTGGLNGNNENNNNNNLLPLLALSDGGFGHGHGGGISTLGAVALSGGFNGNNGNNNNLLPLLALNGDLGGYGGHGHGYGHGGGRYRPYNEPHYGYPSYLRVGV